MARPSHALRYWLGLGSGVSALLFAWAAHTLPWRPGAPLAAVLWLLAMLHAATLVCCGALPRHLCRVWRAASLASLGSAVLFSLAVGIGAERMVVRYGSLGWSLALLLALIWFLLLTATVPIAAWGVVATGGWRARCEAQGGSAEPPAAPGEGATEPEAA